MSDRVAEYHSDEKRPYVAVSITKEAMSDRTAEYHSVCRALHSRRGLHSKASDANGLYGRNRQRSEFTNIAKSLGADIANTCQKLEKLALLAKKKSLFDDRPVEIQELTYIIKQDITVLNQQIGRLQQLQHSQNSSSSKHQQSHSSNVVVSLQSQLANMSKDFKSVLEVRTANLKSQKQRAGQFSSLELTGSSMLNTGANANSSLYGNGGHGSTDDRGDAVIDMGAMSMEVMSGDTYAESRVTAVQTIESTMVELGQIFQQLAHLVSAQGEQVMRIDSNVADTEVNVSRAHTELLKYFENISSNRWLMIKVFFVLIITFVIFVVFMA